jgi:hypothetical protein
MHLKVKEALMVAQFAFEVSPFSDFKFVLIEPHYLCKLGYLAFRSTPK